MARRSTNVVHWSVISERLGNEWRPVYVLACGRKIGSKTRFSRVREEITCPTCAKEYDRRTAF